MLERIHAHCVKNGPKILGLPAAFTPFPVKKLLLQQLLNWQFRHALAEGELDFLDGRLLGIEIADLNLQWITTLQDGRLAGLQQSEADDWVSRNGNGNHGSHCEVTLVIACCGFGHVRQEGSVQGQAKSVAGGST